MLIGFGTLDRVSWIPHLSLELKRLIPVWYRTNYEQRHLSEKTAIGGMSWFSWFVADMFRDWKMETYRIHQIHSSEHWFAGPDQNRKLSWQMPWMVFSTSVFLTWENDLSVHIRRTCKVPTPKRRRCVWGRTPYNLAEARGHRQVMGVLRPASWQPLEPWRRSRISYF